MHKLSVLPSSAFLTCWVAFWWTLTGCQNNEVNSPPNTTVPRQAACDKKIKDCLHENNRHSTMLLSFFLHRPYLPTKRSPRAVLLKTRLARGRLSCGGFTLQRYILTDIPTKESFVSAITKRNPVARRLLIFVKSSCARSGKHWAGFVIQNGNSKGGRSFFCLRCSMGVARWQRLALRMLPEWQCFLKGNVCVAHP